MTYFSIDYQNEVIKPKKAFYPILGLFIVGIGSCTYNPEGKGWIVIAAAIVALARYSMSGGMKHMKSGETLTLEQDYFEHRIIATGYQVKVPYCEIENVRLCRLFPKSIKLFLAGNREQVLKNYSNANDLILEFKKRAGI